MRQIAALAHLASPLQPATQTCFGRTRPVSLTTLERAVEPCVPTRRAPEPQAEKFTTEGLSGKAQAQIIRNASSKGPAHLARTVDETGVAALKDGSSETSNKDSVDYVRVERCSFAVEEVRRRVAELLSRGAEMPPPPETPLALYHVHVLSRARGGREALLRLRYRREGASFQEMDQITEDLPLGLFNFVTSIPNEQQAEPVASRARERRERARDVGALFAADATDVFLVESTSDLGELVGAELSQQPSRTAEASGWSVEAVSVHCVQGAHALLSHPAPLTSGRCWHLAARSVADRETGGVSLEPVRVGLHPTPFEPLQVLHILVHLTANLDAPPLGDFKLALFSRSGSAGPQLRLAAANAVLDTTSSSSLRFHHTVRIGRPGETLAVEDVASMQVELDTNFGKFPVYLESITLWSQPPNALATFSCYEWLNSDEAPMWPRAHAHGVRLHAAEPHCAPPPPPPRPPSLKIREELGASGLPTQMLSVSWEAAAATPDACVRWRLQCVAEGEDEGLDVVLDAPQIELPILALRVGGARLSATRPYFWRVAGVHSLLGSGGFSLVTRAVFSVRNDRFSVAQSAVAAPLPASPRPPAPQRAFAVVAARSTVEGAACTHGVSTVAAAPPEEATGEAAAAVCVAVGATPMHEAVQPRPGEQQLLRCAGDAELQRGGVELTPLRKGMGLAGAVWFSRPVSVQDGFECEFSFAITPPVGQKGRAADGIAFVLQLDPRGVGAIGSAGLSLGYGGVEAALAVQLCATPSCSRRTPPPPLQSPPAHTDAESDASLVLCTLPEPHEHVFFVPVSSSKQECVCPFTGEHFIAPDLDGANDAAEAADLSHHTDRVSVQCSADAVSTGAGASIASAPLLRTIDDGQEHTVRVVMQPNGFGASAETPQQSRNSRSGAEAAHASRSTFRLLVYVDDMRRARINMELDLNAVFNGLKEWKGLMTAGITAGSGKRYASHCVTSWSFYEVPVTVQQKPQPTGTSWLAKARHIVGV